MENSAPEDKVGSRSRPGLRVNLSVDFITRLFITEDASCLDFDRSISFSFTS